MEHLVLEVPTHGRVEPGGGLVDVAALLLDEAGVHPVLDQMGHVAVAQTVRAQRRIQAELIAVEPEPVSDVTGLQPGPALGQPQRIRGRTGSALHD